MSQLEFFPVSAFAVTASLQHDGTWSMMLATNLHADGSVDWKSDRYSQLSLGELLDIMLAVIL